MIEIAPPPDQIRRAVNVISEILIGVLFAVGLYAGALALITHLDGGYDDPKVKASLAPSAK